LAPTREEEAMAKKVECPCGETVMGEDDDELVAGVAQHMEEKHPNLVDTLSREQLLGMAVDA
jgi:predicted small metal-binding protein